MGRKEKWADIPVGHDNPVSYATTTRDSSVIEMVNRAVRHKQVMLAYQAVVSSGDHKQIAFYEGLIRVLDDTGRVIPAREFIQAIESMETGRLIDCLALEIGLKALSRHPDLRLSINMSARSIGYSRWNRVLKNGLGKDPTVAERLILEITESSAMLVPELVISFMNDLQRKGISFALDDFGAGYTSFRYLKEFYFDIVKIDGQFIRGIGEDPDNQVLTAALVNVAEQFNMVSVAENVETPQDVAFLSTLGIDCLQGYYFGAPTVKPLWLDPAQSNVSA